MSQILDALKNLDALKKLDREKSSRPNGPADIGVEILGPEEPRPRKKFPWHSAAACLGAIILIAVVYAVRVEFDFRSKSSSPVRVNPSAPGSQVLSAPSSHKPVHEPAETRQVIPRVQNPVERKISPASLPKRKTSRDSTFKEPPVGLGNSKKAAEPTPDGSAMNPPLLKITVIVWHEEPSERRAVINGTVINEGSVIEGVVVGEIYPARVRFLQNGRPFEISANLSGR